MIDTKYKVRRYIAEFSEKTEELLAEHELTSFDLEKFQNMFCVSDLNNPMFDCYQINEANCDFLAGYIDFEPSWDFKNKSYFVESEAI